MIEIKNNIAIELISLLKESQYAFKVAHHQSIGSMRIYWTDKINDAEKMIDYLKKKTNYKE